MPGCLVQRHASVSRYDPKTLTILGLDKVCLNHASSFSVCRFQFHFYKILIVKEASHLHHVFVYIIRRFLF